MKVLLRHEGSRAQETPELTTFTADDILVQTERAFLLRKASKKAWFPKFVINITEHVPGKFEIEVCDWFPEPRWEDCEERDYD